jgi:predicted ester cyclase
MSEHSAADLLAEKLAYLSAWSLLDKKSAAHWPTALTELYSADVAWHGPHPINAHHGAANVVEKFWLPFLQSFPDLERRDDIMIAGSFKGGKWIGATGYYTATFARDWLGIRATGGVVNIRYGEFSRMDAGRVHEVYVIVDILDIMYQAGCWPAMLPKSRGPLDRVPGPASRDGVTIVSAPSEASEASLKLVEAMIKGLMEYDGKTLASMAMERFWHPHMMWYGPAGIGSSRQLKGFQQVHQIPFLNAFPDRRGGDHKARIGDGAFVGSTGWPSVRATHLGAWQGVPATNRAISMRVMDFWRREDNLLRENWVFIDMIELLLQMDVDVMGSLK